jgi:hypothetical protein
MLRRIALALLVASAACHHVKDGELRQHIAIINATIYPAPGIAPIQHGIIVIRGEDIAAIGQDNDIKVPGDAAVIDAAGQFVVAGFWLLSVDMARFADNDASTALQPALTDTFLKRGYTTVIDTSSNSDSAVAIRERIAEHELEGPSILTAKEVAGTPSTPPETDPESSFDAKLAYLTTWPAKRYGDAKERLENKESMIDEHHRDTAHSGKLTEGARADIVILGSDPKKDLSAFGDVRTTIARGRVDFQR